MATVLVPTPLRRLTGGQAKVEVEGSDIGTLILAIDSQYPGVADKLLDDDGNIKRFINVFVNDSEVRSLQGLHTPVQAGDKVSIVPAMAGGCGDKERGRQGDGEAPSPLAQGRLGWIV